MQKTKNCNLNINVIKNTVDKDTLEQVGRIGLHTLPTLLFVHIWKQRKYYPFFHTPRYRYMVKNYAF